MELVRQKNSATIITFPILNISGVPVSGAAGLDSEIDSWSDTAAPNGFTDCTNEATEIGSSGIYYLSLTQAEMNNDYHYVTTKTSTTNALQQHILIRTIIGDPLNLATTSSGIAILTDVNGTVNSNITTIEGIDATNQIRDSIVTDATRFAGANIASIKTDTVYMSGIVGTVNSKLPTNFIMGSPDAADKLVVNIITMTIPSIDLANTATIAIGASLTTNRGSIPTTAEITPGTLDIRRKAKGATSWTIVRNGVALSELDGIIYYNETFSASNGYAEGDSLQFIIKNTSVVINSVTYAIASSTGIYFYSSIRETGITQTYSYVQSLSGLAVTGNSNLYTITGKLPTNYMMGSSVQTDKDDEIDSILSFVQNIQITGSPAYNAASSYTLTTGTQTSGTYANVDSPNGVYHVHTDVGGVLDLYYEYSLRPDEIGSTFIFKGRINSFNDSVYIQLYDWTTSTWVTFHTLTGVNTTTDTNLTYALVAKYTSTLTASLGKVRIRIVNAVALTTATLYIDQLIVAKSITARTVGYADGSIWVDTIDGSSGVVNYVNGVADNPCLTYADAEIIENSLGIRRFSIVNGSTIAIDANVVPDIENHSFRGGAWTLTFANTVDVTHSYIEGARISGTTTGDYLAAKYCIIGNLTLATCLMESCALAGTLQTIAGKEYTLHQCVDGLAGGVLLPTIAFAAGANVGLRSYTGGIQINNMQTGDNLKLDGAGRLVIDSSCTGGDIVVRGFFSPITGKDAFIAAGGTITEEARFSVQQIISDSTAFKGADIGAISGIVNSIRLQTDKLNFTGTDVKATLDSETVIVGTNNDKSNYTLDSTYDSAKTASSQSSVNSLSGIAVSTLEKVNTINLDTDLVEEGIQAISGIVTAILADTNETQGKLPTNYIMGSSVQSNKDDEIDSISGVVQSIKSKTDLMSFNGTDIKATLDGESVTVGTNNDKSNYTLSSDYDAAKTASSQTSVNSVSTNVTTIVNKLPTNYIMGSSVLTDKDSTIDAIKIKTDNLPSGMKKNVAFTDFEFTMVLTSDHVTGATGKTVTGYISKDGAATFTALTNSVTEKANGFYNVDLTQTEMNADKISLRFTATDCDDTVFFIPLNT